MATVYHEPALSEKARDIHRALASLQEELEAVDWYHQRMDVTGDLELRAVLKHNRDEEIEHASMILEYLRRQMPEVDEKLKTYLFTTLPITEIEEHAEAADGAEQSVKPGAGLGIGAN